MAEQGTTTPETNAPGAAGTAAETKPGATPEATVETKKGINWDKLASNPNLSQGKKDFIKKMGPAIEKAIHDQNLTVPVEGVLGQLALESADGQGNWGQSELARNSNNFAGLTAGSSWHGKIDPRLDKQGEKAGGVTIMQNFRKYDSPQAFADDYVKFIQAPRYRIALRQKDPYHYALELGKAGYHNDNDAEYASFVAKRAAIINPEAVPEFEKYGKQYVDVGNQERARIVSEGGRDYVNGAKDETEKKSRQQEFSNSLAAMAQKNPEMGFFLMLFAVVMSIVAPEMAQKFITQLNDHGINVPDSPSSSQGHGHGGTSTNQPGNIATSSGGSGTQNADPSRNNAVIQTMHPSMRAAARAFVAELKEKGMDVVVRQGDRTNEEQAQLLARGVTKAGPGSSYHNYALACDMVPLQKKWYSNVANEELSNEARDIFRKTAAKHGFEWGGDWKSFTDEAHIQFPSSRLSLGQLRNMSKGRDGFVNLPASTIPQEFAQAASNEDKVAKAAQQFKENQAKEEQVKLEQKKSEEANPDSKKSGDAKTLDTSKSYAASDLPKLNKPAVNKQMAEVAQVG